MNKQREYLSQKKSGQAITLNCFRRSQYAAALRSVGQTVLSAETKGDLYGRVSADPAALAELLRLFDWKRDHSPKVSETDTFGV